MYTVIRRAAAVVALIATAGCTVHNAATPTEGGPSTFATSFTVNAIPDTISQDGGSQSSIKILVIGPTGRSMSAVPMRVDMSVNGVAQDYGTLSARTIVTNSDGVATVVYTAPPSPPNGNFGICANLPGTCIEIVATPTGTNFVTSISQSVTIRLVPPGVILPPAGTPTASFTYSPQPATANLPLQFDASNSRAGTGAGAIVSYNWSFGDGTSGTGRTVTKTYTAQNSYNVTLTVINDRNLSASTTQSVPVGAAGRPTPVFTVSPAAPAVGAPVFFNASSSLPGAGGPIASYRWTFGDGTTGAGVTISHSYAAIGSYIVQLTVTDEAGLSTTSTGTPVTVGNPPAAGTDFTVSPAAPSVGETVTFDYRVSVLQGQPIVALDWNFGDGSGLVHCPGDPACASDGITTHTFLRPGAFNVSLVTTDAAGHTGTKLKTVTVIAAGGGGGSVPPTATFTFGPPSPSVGEAVQFNATASVAGAGRTIASYVWTWGDGSAEGSGVTPTHIFTTAATFGVQVRVTDDIGQATSSAATGVTIGSPQSPTANFTFSPASPGRNDQVVFDGSSSVQAGAGQPIVDVAWNFGDGTAVIHCVPNGTVTPECPGPTIRISAHTFVTNQTFVVNLVVTDSVGRQGTRSQSISIALAQPNVVVSASPSSPIPGQLVTFGSGGTTFFPGSGSGPLPGSYVWSFGNGLGATGQSASTTYAAVGTYTVTLSVTDNTACSTPRCPAGTPGRTGIGTTTVTVVPVTPPVPPAAPVADFVYGPIPAHSTPSTVNFTSTSTRPSGAAITSYTWSFGDATSCANGTCPGTPSGPTHVYPAVPPVAPAVTRDTIYNVTLTITDANGLSSSKTISVTVTTP